MPAKSAIFFVVTMFAMLAFPYAARGQDSPETKGQLVKVEYDSTRNLTQITLSPFILSSRKLEELRLGAVATYPGKVRVRPTEVTLVFLSLSASDATKYDAARKVTVTVDAQHLALGEARYSKQTQNGLFVETLMIGMPLDNFLRISGAKEVTLKIGFTEIHLSEKQLEILRIAASYMTE